MEIMKEAEMTFIREVAGYRMIINVMKILRRNVNNRY